MSPSPLQPHTQIVFGDLSGLNCSAQLLASGKWDAGNVAAPQLIKLSPVVRYDAISLEANASESQAAAGLTVNGSHDNEDCNVEWLVLRVLEYLRRENDKVRSFNSQLKSWSDYRMSQSFSLALTRILSYSHGADNR